MRAEDLLTAPSIAEAVAAEAARLPSPAPEDLERLRELLERTQRPPQDTAWPAFLRPAVERKDTRHADPPRSHRPVVGPALVLTKRLFRLAFQPFINEVMRRQVEFNESLLSAIALLYDTQQENARVQALWRKEMEKRLARLEAALSEASPKPPGPEQPPRR